MLSLNLLTNLSIYLNNIILLVQMYYFRLTHLTLYTFIFYTNFIVRNLAL